MRAGLRDADLSRQDIFAEGADSLAQATVAAAGAMGGSDTGDLTGCQFVAGHDIGGECMSQPLTVNRFSRQAELLLLT